MEKEFIPYELAVKLKELGFNNGCLAKWSWSTISKRYLNFEFLPTTEKYTPAPLWQQSFDWFREKHNLHCVIDEYENPKSWGYLINNDDLDEAFNFNSYKEARLECLKELIKIAEKKQLK